MLHVQVPTDFPIDRITYIAWTYFFCVQQSHAELMNINAWMVVPVSLSRGFVMGLMTALVVMMKLDAHHVS